jgi:TetR/AcrR family transcriptional regulator, tetracycline repressor protein
MARARRAGVIGLWDEAPPARPAVTRERLVREALGLLDDVGFEGLTMRRLAERLGVRAASLYNHVGDKLELVALLGDALCAEVREPDAGADWRAQLETLATDYRRVLLAHRDAARVLQATPPVGPNRLRLVERTLAILRGAGFDDVLTTDAATLFNLYVIGFVLDETQARPSDMPEAAVAQFERWFRSLPAERYPTISSLSHLLLDADTDRRFALGLAALLDGLTSRLARPTQSPQPPRSSAARGK